MKTNRIMIGLFLFIILVVLVTFGVDSSSSERVKSGFEILASLAAILGLLGLLVQFKREGDLAEANFIIQLTENFSSNEDIDRIYKILEDSKKNGQLDNPFSESDIIDMANYLSFFETFWGLINRKLLSIETIDIMAYRFFLATNNKFMQEKLICRPGKEIAWHDLYLLHKKWRDFRLDKGRKVWQVEYDLSKTSAFSKITSGN